MSKMVSIKNKLEIISEGLKNGLHSIIQHCYVRMTHVMIHEWYLLGRSPRTPPGVIVVEALFTKPGIAWFAHGRVQL